MRVEELIARGVSPEAARREAVRQFGDLEFTRQYCRTQDLRKETDVQRGLFFEELSAGSPDLDARAAARAADDPHDRPDGRTGDWRHNHDLRRGLRGAPAAAAVRAPDQLVRIYTDAPPNKFPLFRRRLPGAAGRADALRAGRGIHRPADGVQRRRPSPSGSTARK
jgi:hypothetical protein